MSETETLDMGPIADTGFDSLSAIRVAHLKLMNANAMKGSNGEAQPSVQQIREFLSHASDAGRAITDESDRRSVQRMLDYWSTELVTRPGVSGEDFGQVVLAPADAAAAPDHSPMMLDILAQEDTRSAQYIRLSALARQWKNTGLRGYLLTGDALKEAEAFDDDPEIAALIDASHIAEVRAARDRDRTRTIALTILACLLAAVAIVAVFLLLSLYEANRLQVELVADQAAEREQRETLLAEAAFARTEAESRAMEAEAARVRATERLAQLDDQQRLLDVTLDAMVQHLTADEISLESLPPVLQEELLSRLAKQEHAGKQTMAELPPDLAGRVRGLTIDAPENAFDLDLRGYRADFLGDNVTVPLPTLSGPDIASAFDGGSPVRYANYSVVLNQARRVAFFSAANLDREQRIVLPQVDEAFQFDPRVPEGAQADPAWFATEGVGAVRLVSRHDISWGPYFEGESIRATARLDQVTNVYTNAAPQTSGYGRFAWAEVENYVRVGHNPAAGRVTIFTGPVFNPEGDPSVPSHFWKVAVSAGTASGKGASEDLVVEGFLVPNTARGEGGGSIELDTFRVPVSDIEARTGLDFGDRVRSAGTIPQLDETLPATVSMLATASDAERRDVTIAASAALRGVGVSSVVRTEIVGALLDLGTTADLSEINRFSVLSILSQVPAGSWADPAWLPTTARARRLAADLDATQDDPTTTLDDATRSQLSLFKTNLGLGSAPPQTVHFQFAGMTRGSAEALSAQLRKLGWAIPLPGEERTEAAIGRNEVRYNPASETDRTAAELLAADIVAAGHRASVQPVANELVKQGTIEIWVSI